MDELTYKQMDEWAVTTSNWNIFVNSDMLMVIYVKFHHERTSASQKSNLTKTFNPSWTDLQTNRPKTYMALIIRMPGPNKFFEFSSQQLQNYEYYAT